MKLLKYLPLLGWVVFLGLSGVVEAKDPPPEKWFARVIGGKAPLMFSGKPIEVGSYITSEGDLETGPAGTAKIFFKRNLAVLSLNENGKIRLQRWDKKSKTTEYVLKEGKCRWLTTKKKKKIANIRIRTRSAVMGVRGTDFMAVYNPLFDESEIVVFRGKVQFQSTARQKDSKLIRKGQWGGIGGRFGSKIGKVLNLDRRVLKELKSSLDVASDIPVEE